MVQLLGVWCEGEGRTGRVASDVQRVFWHAWPVWLRRWLGQEVTPESIPGLVRIESPDRQLATALIDTLGAHGVAAVTGRGAESTNPTAIVWDAAQLSGREADRLLTVCDAGAPVIALLDFPRPETVAAARAIGAACVLGKPFDRGSLLESIYQAVAKTARQPSVRAGEQPEELFASALRQAA